MSDTKFYASSSFWSGVGLYYVILWIFTFFPAFIISMIFQRLFFGKYTESSGSYVLGFIVMIVCSCIIVCLAKCEQYFIVLMIYVLTAWPFLYIIHHCCFAADSEIYPLPLDFCPLF